MVVLTIPSEFFVFIHPELVDSHMPKRVTSKRSHPLSTPIRSGVQGVGLSSVHQRALPRPHHTAFTARTRLRGFIIRVCTKSQETQITDIAAMLVYLTKDDKIVLLRNTNVVTDVKWHTLRLYCRGPQMATRGPNVACGRF